MIHFLMFLENIKLYLEKADQCLPRVGMGVRTDCNGCEGIFYSDGNVLKPKSIDG